MHSFDFVTFGQATKSLRRDAEKLSRDVHMASVYVQDTAKSAGQADFDLLHAAQCLEIAARDARLLHARIQQMRADQSNPVLVAAE